MKKLLSKVVKGAMKKSGLDAETIARIEAALTPEKQFKLSKGMIARLEKLRKEGSVAVIAGKRIFSFESYTKRVAGASHLAEYKKKQLEKTDV